MLPDDVKALAPAVLAHRLIPRQARSGAGWAAGWWAASSTRSRFRSTSPGTAPGEADVPACASGRWPAGRCGPVLFFLGTNVQAGWLFVLAALMLGTVAAGWILPVRCPGGVTISRRVPGRVHQGEEALVDLEIVTNAARRGRRGLIVHDPHLEPSSL